MAGAKAATALAAARNGSGRACKSRAALPSGPCRIWRNRSSRAALDDCGDQRMIRLFVDIDRGQRVGELDLADGNAQPATDRDKSLIERAKAQHRPEHGRWSKRRDH